MIEVDLLTDGGRPRSRWPQMSVKGLPVRGLRFDGWVIGSGLAILSSLGFAAHLLLMIRTSAWGIEEAMQEALRDSVRNTAFIQKVQTLEARRDSIAGRVAIIQEIDARRYIWPRIMVEVARALPTDAWLTYFAQAPSTDEFARFQVEGKTRSNIALTRFWSSMESSHFIRDVRLISTEHVVEGSAADGTADLYYFVLEATQEDPPPEMLNLAPLVPPTTP